jgi:hypothetical protein
LSLQDICSIYVLYMDPFTNFIVSSRHCSIFWYFLWILSRILLSLQDIAPFFGTFYGSFHKFYCLFQPSRDFFWVLSIVPFMDFIVSSILIILFYRSFHGFYCLFQSSHDFSGTFMDPFTDFIVSSSHRTIFRTLSMDPFTDFNVSSSHRAIFRVLLWILSRILLSLPAIARFLGYLYGSFHGF